jgi:hypothetical protein
MAEVDITQLTDMLEAGRTPEQIKGVIASLDFTPAMKERLNAAVDKATPASKVKTVGIETVLDSPVQKRVDNSVPEGVGMPELALAIETTPTSSDEYTKMKAVETSLVKTKGDSIITQEELGVSVMELNSGRNIQEIMDLYQGVVSSFMKANLLRVIKDDVAQDPSVLEHYAPTLQATDALRAQQVTGDQKGTVATISDLYANETLDEFSLRSKEAENYMWSKYAEYTEDKGLFSKIVDGTGLLLLPDFTKDASDVAKALNGKRSDLMDIISGFQEQDPATQMQLIDQIFPVIVEAFEDNAFKVGAYMSLMYDPKHITHITQGMVFDGLEIGSIIAAPIAWTGKAAKTMAAGVKPTKELKNLGATDEAVKLNELAQATGDPSLTKIIAGDEVDVAMNSSPFKFEETVLSGNAMDGLAGEQQRLKELIRAEVRAPMAAIRDDKFLMQTDALTMDEKAGAVDSFIVGRQALAEKQGKIVDQAVVIASDDSGFKVRYKVAEEGAPNFNVVETVKYTRSDVGVMEASSVEGAALVNSKLGGKIFSPERLLSGTGIVETTTAGGLQSSRLRNVLVKQLNDLDTGMNRKQKVAVDELMLAGDEQEVVFSLKELLSGTVEVKSGKRAYTTPEIENYYKKRAFMDELWMFQDKKVRDQLDFLGYKEVRYSNNKKIEGIDLGIPRTSLGAAVDDFVFMPGRTKGGEFVKRSDMGDVPKLQDEGWQAIQLLEPKTVAGNNNVTWMMVRAGGEGTTGVVKGLPRVGILNKVPGYVPRVRRPGLHYVKDAARGSKTVRAFEGKKAAQAWADEQMAAQRLAGVSQKDASELVVRADQNLTPSEILLEDARSGGGLYTGSRSKDPILVGADGVTAERFSTGQATQRYLQNIADSMPLNRYRQALSQRFINTVNDIAKREGKASGFTDQNDWVNTQLTLEPGNQKEMMEQTRRYLVDQLHIPENNERTWENFISGIVDGLEGKAPLKVRQGIMDLASKDPVRAMKGATFNLHLGWFNLRQLYVQSQNASLAIAMFPTQAPRALPKALALRSAILISNKQSRGSALIKAGKALGLDADDLQDSADGFIRSGMNDSIMRTADYDANLSGFTNGTLESTRRLASHGRIFYEEGERFSRLVVWDIARHNWKKANVGKAVDDKALRQITDDALGMHLNLQRENSAWWQNNILTGPATQFLQVQAKMVENLLPVALGGGTKWTAAQKSKVFAGQILLYGVVGVPLVEDATNYMVEQLGVNFDELANDMPLVAEGLNDGALGVLFEAMGVNNTFGISGSLLANLDDNVIGDLARGIMSLGQDDTGFFELATGPTTSTVTRGADAIISVAQAAADIWRTPTIEEVGKASLRTLDTIGDMTSAWNNASKTWFLQHQGIVASKRGDLVFSKADLGDLNMQTMMARAMGFPLDIETAYWDIKDHNRIKQQVKKDVTIALKRGIVRYAATGDIEALTAYKIHMLSGFTELEQAEIMEGVLKGYTGKESSLDRELNRLVTDYIKSGGRNRLPFRATELTQENR